MTLQRRICAAYYINIKLFHIVAYLQHICVCWPHHIVRYLHPKKRDEKWRILSIVFFISFHIVTYQYFNNIKGARSDCFKFFSNFQRFWYQEKAHIFLITPGEFNA